MNTNRIERILFDAVTPVAVTSSTDALPVVVTATAHGFQTGDRAMIQGHTTNIVANGIYKVTRVDANNFSLQDEISGTNVQGSGGGAGAAGICFKAPPILYVSDFRNVILQVFTSGTATTTLKVAGSLGKPNSTWTTPRYDFINMGATVTPEIGRAHV